MPENTMRIDRHMPGTRLDRLVTQKVTEILDAMPDAPGRRDRRGVQIRAFQRVEGVPRRPLQARAHRQGRHARAEGAQTEGRPVRIGGGRTLPPVRGKRRGGPDRRVHGGRLHPPGRRHQPAAVSREDALAGPLRQTQEGVRLHRLVAHEAVGARVPVRVHGRCVTQALVGRLGGEREHARRRRGLFCPTAI